MRRLFRLALMAGITLGTMLFGLSNAGLADGLDLGRQSLQGLEGVHVIVRKLPLEIEGKALTRKGLREAVESKLKKAKIKVLSTMECLSTKGGPSLDVDLKVSKPSKPLKESSGYIYTIDVRLAQGIYLARDSKINMHADTWKVKDYGQALKLDEIKNHVMDMIDRFISSYQAANTEKNGPDLTPGLPTEDKTELP